LGGDAFEQDGRGFVGGVLGDELAGESGGEDGGTKVVRSPKLYRYDSVQPFNFVIDQ